MPILVVKLMQIMRSYFLVGIGLRYKNEIYSNNDLVSLPRVLTEEDKETLVQVITDLFLPPNLSILGTIFLASAINCNTYWFIVYSIDFADNTCKVCCVNDGSDLGFKVNHTINSIEILINSSMYVFYRSPTDVASIPLQVNFLCIHKKIFFLTFF